MKYYSSKEIRALNCRYNWIIGKRSNGKSFDFAINGVRKYLETGKQFAWLRRFDEDFAKNRGKTMFAFLERDGNGVNQIEELSGGEWNAIFYYSRQWFLARYDFDLDKMVKDKQPFAYGFAISQMQHDKGSSFPNVDDIIFDEALTRDGYLDDEYGKLMNCISTIARERDTVKVWLLGNTVNTYCPHFEEMGLYKIKDQEPGTIQVYNVGEDNRVRIAVEYCAEVKNTKSKKTTNELYAFDNPHIKMMTTGQWETGLYPRCPMKYDRKDIIFSFFIIFNHDTLQCDVISVDSSTFIFVHTKTGEIKYPDTDLIFSTDYDPRPNHRRKITSPTLPVEKKIWELFRTDKVFYQSNPIGEIVRNYFEWSTKQ